MTNVISTEPEIKLPDDPEWDKAALVGVDITKSFNPTDPNIPGTGEFGGGVSHGNEIIPVWNKLCPYFEHRYLSKDFHNKTNKFFAANHGVEPFSFVKSWYKNAGPEDKIQTWPWHDLAEDPQAGIHPDVNTEGAFIFRKGRNDDVETLSIFVGEDRIYEPVYDNGKTAEQHFRDEGTKYLFVGGLAEDYCAGKTALDAAKKGFKVVFVTDMTRGVVPEQVEAMREELKAAGVKFMTSDEVIKLRMTPGALAKLFADTPKQAPQYGNGGGRAGQLNL